MKNGGKNKSVAFIILVSVSAVGIIQKQITGWNNKLYSPVLTCMSPVDHLYFMHVMHYMYNFRKCTSFFLSNCYSWADTCVDLTLLVQDGAIFLSSISPWDSGSQTGSELWVGEREWDWWSERGRLPVPWWRGERRENKRMIVLFSLQRNCCCKRSKQRGKRTLNTLISQLLHWTAGHVTQQTT